MTFTFLSEPLFSHFFVQLVTPDSFLLAFFFYLFKCKASFTHVLPTHSIMLSAGPQHSGRNGDGRDGPRDQHEWNHHTGGCPEQDGEIWGTWAPCLPVVCTILISVRPLRYGTVCRHACMLHHACYSPVAVWMLPYDYWVFVFFIPAAVLQTQVLSISSPVPFCIKYSIIVTFIVT